MQRKITEFTKAEELLLLMSSARTLGDYEEYWKDFLHKIDKGCLLYTSDAADE